MSGHVAKKGKRYYAVVYEGVDSATGWESHRWYVGVRTLWGAKTRAVMRRGCIRGSRRRGVCD